MRVGHSNRECVKTELEDSDFEGPWDIVSTYECSGPTRVTSHTGTGWESDVLPPHVFSQGWEDGGRGKRVGSLLGHDTTHTHTDVDTVEVSLDRGTHEPELTVVTDTDMVLVDGRAVPFLTNR